MLALRPQNMLNMLVASNSPANGFIRARRADRPRALSFTVASCRSPSLYGCGWVAILYINLEPSPQLWLSH
jgi:hypothetical protein